MSRLSLGLLPLLLGALTSCSLTTPSTDIARAAISQAWSGFKTAWLAGDVPSATAAFFTPEAMNVMPDAPASLGRAAIDTSFREFFANTKVLALDQTTEEVEVAGDLAYERGIFAQSVQQGQAGARTLHARYLAVWKRQSDGTWKCHRFLFNYAPQSS